MRYLGLLFVLAICGCGEKNRDILARYTPRFADKRAELSALARQLPPPGVSLRFTNQPPLAPKPVFIHGKDEETNTDFLSVEELSDPDATPALELYLSHGLSRGLQWTGPKNPMSETAMGDRNKQLAHELDLALSTRYLVVVRSLVDVKAEAVNDKTFRGGARIFEALVFDLQDKKLRAAVAVLAEPDATVNYSYKVSKQGGQALESKEAALERAVQSAAWSSARKQLGPKLEQATGGTFVFDL